MNVNDPKDIAQAGLKIYYEMYRVEYEAKYPGQFLAINILDNAAILGTTATAALTKARQARPAGVFHLIRIGHTGAFEVGTAYKHVRTDRLHR